MSTLHITRDGSVLRKVDERLKVTFEKETIIDVPLIKVDQVIVWGRVTVTPQTVSSLWMPILLLEAGKTLGP